LTVLTYHATDNVLPSGGFIGVDVFFCLSGFLITSLLVQEFDSKGTIRFKAFYLRRILRLFPALFCMLLLYSVFILMFFEFRTVTNYLTTAVIALFYMVNWVRAFALHPAGFLPNMAFLGHTWSLSIEEQFYVLWPPLLLLLLGNVRRHVVALSAVSLAVISWSLRYDFSISGATVNRLFNGLDTRADALMVGCALGVLIASNLITERLRPALRRGLRIAAPISITGLAGIAAVAHWYDLWLYFWGFFIVAILSAVIISDCVLNADGVLARLLSLKPLVWVGTISYGLYLWHYPIYRMMRVYRVAPVYVMTLGTLAAFALTIASYYGVERPFLRIKKRYETAHQWVG
jgi:peptidoglycan/LPS O-acetylase OafA/YrhL